ncbi:MAG: recombinase family protein [Sodalis sp. (in: enterobacteria)]
MANQLYKNTQNTALQKNPLTYTNYMHIFKDKKDQRSKFKRVLSCLKSGNTLAVQKPDRPERRIKRLITLISNLKDADTHLHSLTYPIYTTLTGRYFFHVMSTLP